MFQLPLAAADGTMQSLTLREGARVGGRFRLGALLERRRDLAVFEATDEQSGHCVRLRLRPVSGRPDPRLLHPAIAQYADHGCIGEWTASVLDPGEGEPLARVLRQHAREAVEPGAVVALGVDLLGALAHAHAHGVTHGDLGVHSVHVGPEWGGRIVDFTDEVGALRDEALPFASPERLNGDRGDARSDLYALAALLYSLGAGHPPFGIEPQHAREGHLYQALPPSPALHPALHEVFAIAMAKRPERRYATAAAFSDALLDAWSAIAAETPEPDDEPALDARLAGAAALGTLGSLEPAPIRRHRPEPVDDDAAAMWIPAVLISVLCLLVAGLASASVLAAGALWWLTSVGGEPIPGSSPSSAVERREAPEAATPAEPRREAPRLVASSGSAASSVDRAASKDAPQVLVESTLADRAEAAGRRVAAPVEGQRVPVRFAYDSYEAEVEPGFDAFAREARAQRRVRLTGHTDARGSQAANELMGLGRAWSVGLLLKASGVDDARIELASAGSSDPAASNATEAGRAANRRVTAEFPREARVSDLLVHVN